MSRLHRGDENLHYSDNSHRWLAPTDAEQASWEAKVRAHLDEHRATIGGPAEPEQPRRRRSRRAVEPTGRARQPRRAAARQSPVGADPR